ncbi:MAG: glycosyltransferase [Gammaproteobacteria bacterium]|nr:glycosyltransferase [Gammaproteobacteria bacterium]
MVNVAIITPVYNTQDYLHRCINSVLEQQGVSFQYFIIDDGSTDNSASIAQYYQRKDRRVTFIRKANEGQGTARNIGIKLANAEYVYFVDSDDYLGENTLSILYRTAKENGLDICSPNVPKHYFEKPLEYVSCLPCKSQFIMLDIIRDFEILQPAIRSGQDGVFSHLVLTHCRRIGMATNAIFHYSHAREGATFTTHLTRHDLVPTLLEQHYSAIEQHYDKFNLWSKNALRLLTFVGDESLRNRVEPHLPHLDINQKFQCFKLLSEVAKKAHGYLSAWDKSHISLPLAALVTRDVGQLVTSYELEFAGKTFDTRYPSDSIVRQGMLLICKYANSRLTPTPKMIEAPATVTSGQDGLPPVKPPSDSGSDLRFLRAEFRALRGKLDLAINAINNSTIQITSAVRTPANGLSQGNPNIVVSLTTLPYRLPLVHFAIESLFAQTVLPGRIILWITNRINSGNAHTPQIEALVARGLEIKQVEDLGPHTKLLYALREFPDKKIITVDDDIIYPINSVQCLWEQHLKFPNAVICNWARELAFNLEGKVHGVRAGKLLTPPTLESEIEQSHRFHGSPNLLAFPYGTAGVLYPPNALSTRVFEVETFKQLCPTEDDVWFKAMSLLNRTPVVVTNLGTNPVHHCITGSQSDALRHDNHGLGQNSKQINDVFEYLDLYRFIK